MSIWLAATLVAHGGPPLSSGIVFDGGGPWTLETSHGFVTRSHEWVCDEIGAGEFATGLLRVNGGWVVSTTAGVLLSPDGCDWSSQAELDGTYVFRVVTDVADPSRVWVGTNEGLHVSDNGGPFVAEGESELWLTDFGQAKDGRFFELGFLDSAGVVRIGGLDVALPESSGGMRILGLDAADRAYVRVPLGLQDRVYRVGDDGAVDDMLGLVDPVIGFTQIDGSLYMLQRGHGTRWSADDGTRWSEPRGAALRCLEFVDGALFGCPDVLDAPALVEAERTSEDPSDWEWAPLAWFSNVQPLTCSVGSTFDQRCRAVWPIVAVELGVLDGRAIEDGDAAEAEAKPAAGADEEGGGCTIRGRAALAPALLLLLVPALRRRRECSRSRSESTEGPGPRCSSAGLDVPNQRRRIDLAFDDVDPSVQVEVGLRHASRR